MTPANNLRSPVGVAIMFGTNGAVFSSVLPWYPTLKQQWGLDDLTFGLIVACFAAGSLVSTVLPSLAVNRFGPRPVVFWGTVFLALLVAGIGWAPSGLLLAGLLLGIGLLDAVIDVSQNVAGVRVEARAGRSILSAMHACWSMGAVFGGISGTTAASLGWDIRAHLALVATVVITAVAIGVWLTGPVPAPGTAPERADGTGVDKRRPLGRIMLLTLPVALLATAGTMVEDIANNWAGLSSVELAGVEVGNAGVAFTVVLAAQMVGRFTGDRLIDRFGRVAVARAGGLLIGLGGLGVVTATGPVLLYTGYAFVGFGCATLVPSAFAAAARLPGMTEGAGVTAVSWMMRIGFLATSPVLGALSAATSLRWAMLLLVVAGVVVTLAAPALRNRPQATAGT